MLCKFKGEISLGITNARRRETRGKEVNFNNVEQGAEARSATFLLSSFLFADMIWLV